MIILLISRSIRSQIYKFMMVAIFHPTVLHVQGKHLQGSARSETMVEPAQIFFLFFLIQVGNEWPVRPL